MTTLKTPSFWYREEEEKPSISERLLTPISGVYEMFYHLHQNSKKAYKAAIPIICLGNIVAGGTGKTPTALAMMNIIKDSGLAQNPYFMIRGYGGSENGPLQVDPALHTSWEVGDEALILSRAAPTIVAADRAEGAKFARTNGADLIIMDDGLQNPGIHKDLKFIVLNGEMGFGNAKLIPAGPLRQPLEEGLDHADAFILIGTDKHGIVEKLPAGKPVLRAALKPLKTDHIDYNARYIAFAGLGYPDKFFNFLKEDIGLNVVKTVCFADHCPYEEKDIFRLKAQAHSLEATLITTEKDFMRLPKTQAEDIKIMSVHMTFENTDTVTAFIADILKK